jgi:3-oxoadipate enol-lactonase
MRIGDLDLNVRSTGSGRPFLWGHGMLSSMDAEDAHALLEWQQFPASLRLVRYDARGHGASACADGGRAPTWHQLGDDMLALADALGEDRFIAGGWSMGCASALHAALRQPARIDGLVLVVAPALWEARVAQAALYRRAIAVAQSMGAARFARLIDSQGGALPPWLRAAAPQLAAGLPASDPASLLALYDGAARSDLPPRAQLAALSAIPALIVGWPGDAAHPLASAQELHRLLPMSNLFIAHDYRDVQAIPARLRAFVEALGAGR